MGFHEPEFGRVVVKDERRIASGVGMRAEVRQVGEFVKSVRVLKGSDFGG